MSKEMNLKDQESAMTVTENNKQNQSAPNVNINDNLSSIESDILSKIDSVVANCKDQTPEFLIQNGYFYISLLGEGANGKTYKARNLKTGEIVAVKALKFSENLKNYELFKREAEVLQAIKIDGVPRYYDYITQCDEFTECWLVQEYIQGESILDRIENGKVFSQYETLIMMHDMAKIILQLQTLYLPPIIHRDIKPSNILLNGEFGEKHSISLIDFGAVANPQKRGQGSTVAGTVGYMAPEQLVGDCTLQSDYYALGATALHMLTGVAPCDFPSDGFNLNYKPILARVQDTHQELIELLDSLLTPDTTKRPKDAFALLRLVDDTLLKLYEQRAAIAIGCNDYKVKKSSFAKPIFFAFVIVFFIPMVFYLFNGSMISILVVVPIAIAFMVGSGREAVKQSNSKIAKVEGLPDGVNQGSSEEATNTNYIEDSEEITTGVIRACHRFRNAYDGCERSENDWVVEYTYVVKGKCYVGLQYASKQYSVGQKLRIKYQKRWDEMASCVVGV